MTQIERRSHLEQWFSVLEVVSKGSSGATRTLYKSNLRWKDLNAILDDLGDHGLIVWNWQMAYNKMNRTNLMITTRGREILAAYHDLKARVVPEEIEGLWLPTEGGISR